SPRWRTPPCSKASPACVASPSSSSARSARCSRSPPTGSPRRSRASVPPRSSPSSTARASRCIAVATTCASSLAAATTSPRPSPSSSTSRARSPRTSSCSTVKRSCSAPTGARSRSRPRCAASASVEALVNELPLSSFFFDCLYVDGQALVDAPNSERNRALVERVPESARVPRIVVVDPAEADRFLERALAAGHEELLANEPDVPFEPWRPAALWIKINVAHTLELVVLAVEWGRGRRTGLRSVILLGARDPESGGFAMIGKTCNGMTDAMLAWQTEQFKKLAVRSEGNVVHLRPEMVVEIAFDGVQERSEERRVGEEWREGGARSQYSR